MNAPIADDVAPEDPAPRYVGPAAAPRVAARMPDDVLAALGTRPRLDRTTAWWVLAFQEYPAHRSFFEGVSQVASREEIRTREDGTLEVRVPPGPAPSSLDDDGAAAALRAAVVDAVEDTLRDARRAAVLLSGGLDSSIVSVAASVAWKRLGRAPDDLRLHHELPVEGEGELGHARAVASHLGLPLQVRRAGWADPFEGTEACLRRMPMPVDDGGVSNLLDIARTLRDDGVDTVLTGDGGDEAFDGWWFRPWRRRTAARTAVALAEHAARSLARPVRDALSGERGALRRRCRAAALPPGLVATAPQLVRGIDYPPARAGLRGARARRDRATRAGRMMLSVATLRAASEVLGVRTRFPLLDARVLDPVVALDPRRFLTARDGTDKRLARRAFAGDLPPTEAARTKWSRTGVPVQRAWQQPRMRGWYERYVRGGALEREGLVDDDTATSILRDTNESLDAHWRARALVSLGAWCSARGL